MTSDLDIYRSANELIEQHGAPAVAAGPAVKRAVLLAAALIVHGCAPTPVYPLYTSVQVAGSFGYAEQRISDARYTVTYTAPVQRTYAYGGERPDQGADRFKGWTAYEREREEARMRVISASMDRALGHGKLRRNPPVQEHQYCPFDW